jgi:ComEC/Rec2-related protein
LHLPTCCCADFDTLNDCKRLPPLTLKEEALKVVSDRGERAALLAMAEETELPKKAKSGGLRLRFPPSRGQDHAESRYLPRSVDPPPPPVRRTTAQPGWRAVPQRIAHRMVRMRRQFPVLVAQEAEHGHAFLFVPVLIGAGAATSFQMLQDAPFWPYVAALVVFAVLAVLSRHTTSPLRLLPACLALFLCGMLLAALEVARLDTVILDTPVTTQVTGMVERREVDAEGHWRYIVQLQNTTSPELRRPPRRVSLLARARHDPAGIGDMISGRVRLSPPSGPALPGLNDFAFSSYFDGIGAVGFFYGAPDTGAIPVPTDAADQRQAGFGLKAWLFDLRSTVGNRIRAIVPGDPGAFAAAIVTDERRAISKDTTEALRVSGLAHIVAISGLNMALAAGIFFVGVRKVLSLFTGFAQAYPIKKIAAIGALAMVTAYYLISGFGVSAERAYIMMAVILVAVLFDRQSLSLRNVALSALIIVVASPSEILGPSFQMSFAATAALIAGYAAWQRRAAGNRARSRNSRAMRFHWSVTGAMAISRFMAGIVMTSLIGSLSTAIFSVNHFHRIATYGLAANLAAMPLISFVVMPAGLVGMLLMPFGLEAPFLKLMGLGLEGVIGIARYVAAWGGNVEVGRQHPWFLGLAAIGFVLLTLLRTRLRLAGLPFIAFALLLSWQRSADPPPDILIAEDGVMVALLGPGGVSTNRTRVPDFIYDQWRRALSLPDPVKPLLLGSGDGRGFINAESYGANRPGNTKGGSDSHRSSPVGESAGSTAGMESGDDERSHPARSGSGLKATGRRDKEYPALTAEQLEAARAAMRDAPLDRFACVPKAWCAVRARAGPILVVVEDARYAGAACDTAAIVVAARARFDRCRSAALMLNATSLRKTGSIELSLAGSADIRHWTLQTAMLGQDRPWTRHRFYDWRTRAFDQSLPEPLNTLVNGSGGSVPPASLAP